MIAPAQSITGPAIEGSTAREIAASVERGVRVGAIPPGTTLPTVRALAAELGVSPATVASAYRDLSRRGVVTSAGRAGTKVRPAPPISVRGLPEELPAGVRDLRSGAPDPELLPRLDLSVRRSATRHGRTYGEPPVSPSLARAATAQLAADGIDASSLAVVGGALDGVERVLGAWLHPGDRVAVEDPGYTAVYDLLRALGFDLVPVAVDDHGAVPASLEAALEHSAAVVLTPRAQNPTGAAWSVERAHELRRLLGHHGEVVVIEDDHAGQAAGAAALTVTQRGRRWATIRSVSKWLGPDLRLAVTAGDPTTISRVAGRQALGAGWVSYLLQDTVAALWEAPSTTKLLDRAAATYRRRRAALLQALRARGFSPTGSSGLTTWVPMSGEHEVVSALLDLGWAVSPGERFRLAAAPGIRVAFATLSEREAPALAEALASCVAHQPMRTG